MFVFVWVRWTFPRFRYDQLMRLGWKVLLPVAILNLIAGLRDDPGRLALGREEPIPMELLVFLIFAFLAVASALVVVAHRNPVYSTMSLVVTLFSVAVLFVLLGAPFIGALQVLIYTGAIVVLFLFVIMLLNIGREESQIAGHKPQLVGSILGAVRLRRPGDPRSARARRPTALPQLSTELVSLKGLASDAVHRIPAAVRDRRPAAPGGRDRRHGGGAPAASRARAPCSPRRRRLEP